jgi:hypothetical protein
LHLFVDRAVVWPVQRTRTQILVFLVQIAIARHEDAIAVFQECTGIHELSIAVDNKARVVVNNSGDTKTFRQRFGDRPGTNIDRQVTTSRERVEPHITEGPWETVARMVAHEQYWLFCQGVKHPERSRLIRRQQRVDDAWVGLSCHSLSAIYLTRDQCTVTGRLRHPWQMRM